jgi:hypothetical protein
MYVAANQGNQGDRTITPDSRKAAQCRIQKGIQTCLLAVTGL